MTAFASPHRIIFTGVEVEPGALCVSGKRSTSESHHKKGTLSKEDLIFEKFYLIFILILKGFP